MFRCDNCGSGYSSQAASSWTSCPRCMAKEQIQVPLSFELGWQRQGAEGHSGVSGAPAGAAGGRALNG
jgi:hypothetical protein